MQSLAQSRGQGAFGKDALACPIPTQEGCPQGLCVQGTEASVSRHTPPGWLDDDAGHTAAPHREGQAHIAEPYPSEPGQAEPRPAWPQPQEGPGEGLPCSLSFWPEPTPGRGSRKKGGGVRAFPSLSVHFLPLAFPSFSFSCCQCSWPDPGLCLINGPLCWGARAGWALCSLGLWNKGV